jgi:site-specific DNA-methyltransferase (adenine-specific)
MTWPDDYINKVTCEIFNIVEQIPDNSIDLIVTDPAYWTLDRWRNVGTTTRLGGNRDKNKQSGWFETIDEEDLWILMGECYRILKPNCHCYIMSDGQVLKWILGYAEEAGFSNYKPIVWDKVNQGMGYHYRCRHEYFVMLDKGKNRKLTNLSTPDIWAIPMIRGGYPTEKPVELMEIPIIHSSSENEIVLDMFCGSGSTLVAAKKNNRRYIGIDNNPLAVDTAIKRLISGAEYGNMEMFRNGKDFAGGSPVPDENLPRISRNAPDENQYPETEVMP